MCIADPTGGEVLTGQVDIMKQPTPPTQDVISSQEIGSLSVSRSASEQRPQIPLSLASQISKLLESRTVCSKVPQGTMSQSASRPSSLPNSQPGSRVSSQPGSRAGTPQSSSGRQQHATSFAATYRSPFVSPSGFPQPKFGPPHAPLQQNFLPQHTQTSQWSSQHVIPCTPFSQPIHPTFAGPFPMLQAGEAYLPPPSFFQRQTPAFPITLNFRTLPDSQPANPSQKEAAPESKSRSTSASTSAICPPRCSGSPKVPPPAAPYKRSPSAAIEQAADKMVELILSTSQQRSIEESAKFSVERQAWHADSKQKTREIKRLRQRIVHLEQVAAQHTAVEPAPAVETSPTTVDGVPTAEAEVKRLQLEVVALQERIVHLTTHVSRLKGVAIEKMALEATVRTLQSANLDQDARLATHRARREDSTEKMLRHKTRADAAVRQLKAKDARIAELERAVEAAEVRGQAARAELETLPPSAPST
ncbi:hypothetical protein HYPSUDRAFT_325173 [Hypholoma sublateritium FD-334 SS-4]|uniref:Uncharacterized protein n=1 Tax=Hypholoma sublateritium (strain FD-334 SS-4) TaxID=945553 RepID=A0A0D2KN36_HYPSF|nr:hypothetical protein HYPSUDRAFT_325173 [Hypholoma sublateritium FD-334 SS-4]